MAAKQATVSSYVMLVVVVISLVVVNCVSAKPSDVLSKYSRKTILKLKDDRGPRIGLIAVDGPEEEAFFATGDFVPDSENPLLDLAGRRYHYGKIHGKGVVYVRCGVGLRNAVAATTTMIYELYVTGIIHFGVAGNANNSLSIGDVIIPKRFAHTGLWDWRNPNEPLSSNDVAHLEFGSYNVPEGEVTNKLGSVGYSPEEYYSNAGVIDEPEKKFWVETSKNLHDLASKLKGMELQRCVFSSCLLRKPEVVVGLKGSTSDIFVDNAAYREFLFKTFGVSSLDMESAHVVMTSLSADSPVIVFRGLSNLAGAKSEEDQSSDFSSLASINVAEAVVQFIKTLSDEYMDF